MLFPSLNVFLSFDIELLNGYFACGEGDLFFFFCGDCIVILTIFGVDLFIV
jgi:hypothetical protein